MSLFSGLLSLSAGTGALGRVGLGQEGKVCPVGRKERSHRTVFTPYNLVAIKAVAGAIG